jgi:hypothetical protein
MPERGWTVARTRSSVRDDAVVLVDELSNLLCRRRDIVDGEDGANRDDDGPLVGVGGVGGFDGGCAVLHAGARGGATHESEDEEHDQRSS